MRRLRARRAVSAVSAVVARVERSGLGDRIAAIANRLHDGGVRRELSRRGRDEILRAIEEGEE